MKFFALLCLSALLPLNAMAKDRDCTLDIPVAKYDEKGAKYSDDKNEVTEKLELNKQVSVEVKTSQCNYISAEYKFSFTPALEKKDKESVKPEYLKAVELLELFETQKEKPFLQEKQALKAYIAVVKQPKLQEGLFSKEGTNGFAETVKIEAEEGDKVGWIKVITNSGPY